MANDAAQSLLVRIEATTAQLQRELKAADKSVGKHEKTVEQRLAKAREHFERAGKRVAKYGAATAAAAAAAGAAMVRSGLQQIDTLAKTSSKLGIATEELAKLRFAAEQTGVSSKTLDMALQRMTRRVAEAGQGTGEAVKALEELGLNAKELAAQSPDEVFRKVAGAMEGVDNQSDKLRLAFKLFDSEGAALVNTLAEGESGLVRLGEEASAAGLAITDDMAVKVEAANDALNKVSKLTQGLSQQLAVKFAPALAMVGEKLFGVGTESVDMERMATRAFQNIIRAVGVVGDAFRGLEIVFLTVKAGVMTLVTGMLAGFDAVLRGASELASKIPGVDIDYEGSNFARFYSELVDDTFDSAQAVRDKLNEELPSNAFKRLAEEANESLETIPPVATKASDSLEYITVSAKRVSEELPESMQTAAKSTEDSVSAMSTSVTRGFERMRDGVGDFFTRMIQDGEASFSSLLDMFKRVIAEMIATAASKRIMIGFGLGGASAGASAGSIFSGGVSGIGSSLLGGLGGAGAGLYNTIGQGASVLADLGIPGMGSLSTSAFGRGMTMTGGQMLGNIGAGLAGGFLGNKVFGDTSGIGSALGGIGGSIFNNPIFSAIGSFLGSGLESLIGNNEPSDRTGTARLNLSSGDVVIGGLSGKKFSQENRDAAAQIAEVFKGFAQAIGGSSGSLDIGVGNRDGLRLDGRDFGENQAGFIAAGFDKIIASATELSPVLRDLIRSFDGTAEQTIAYASTLVEAQGRLSDSALQMISAFQGSSQQAVAMIGALTNLSAALNTEPVQLAREVYAEASDTLAESYTRHMENLQELITGYDGSLQATQELSSSLSTNVDLAFRLAQSLMEASQEIQIMTNASAQSIRQSIMSEEELRKSRKEELNALVENLKVLSDPTEIRGTVAQIERLNMQVFRSLGPDAQKAQAEAFAGFIEMVNDVAQKRLDESITDLEAMQMKINASVGDVLSSAASSISGAAREVREAAAAFPSSIGVTVEVRYPKQTSGDSLGDVPRFASGGEAKAGLAIVGEQGPELVRFKRPGHVFTASETNKIMSGSQETQNTQSELRALALMMSKQLKIWQRVTRDGEALRTTAA